MSRGRRRVARDRCPLGKRRNYVSPRATPRVRRASYRGRLAIHLSRFESAPPPHSLRGRGLRVYVTSPIGKNQSQVSSVAADPNRSLITSSPRVFSLLVYLALILGEFRWDPRASRFSTTKRDRYDMFDKQLLKTSCRMNCREGVRRQLSIILLIQFQMAIPRRIDVTLRNVISLHF